MTRKGEIEVVKMIGDKIGYGHTMELASALWRRKLKETGTPENGAFVPVATFQIKDDEMEMVEKNIKNYDLLVARELDFKIK